MNPAVLSAVRMVSKHFCEATEKIWDNRGVAQGIVEL